MRILLDQAVHDHRNKGNNALLTVAYDRLRSFWPAAAFDVISDAPYFCQTYLPPATPVMPGNLHTFAGRQLLLPRRARAALFELREISYRWTGLPLSIQQLRPFARADDAAAMAASDDVGSADDSRAETHQPDSVYGRISRYDLYVATGGGYLCDSDKYFLLGVLNRLEAAVHAGVPAVMVGQGVGPLTDPELMARAATVLPQIDYLFIREERAARPLLDTIGVRNEKIIMTGDDAIELAYDRRFALPGTGIGISMRVASHTGMDMAHLTTIRPIIQAFAATHRAPLVAAPISYYRHESDIEPISTIMTDYDACVRSRRNFEDLDNFIARVGRCRIMISGTCHGAVFALSQGIPVICLAKSLEYMNKLAGLSAEFGARGCEVVALDDPQLGEKLSKILARTWDEADELRVPLLNQARRQIELGHAAYRKIYDLVERRQQIAEPVLGQAPQELIASA